MLTHVSSFCKCIISRIRKPWPFLSHNSPALLRCKGPPCGGRQALTSSDHGAPFNATTQPPHGLVVCSSCAPIHAAPSAVPKLSVVVHFGAARSDVMVGCTKRRRPLPGRHAPWPPCFVSSAFQGEEGSVAGLCRRRRGPDRRRDVGVRCLLIRLQRRQEWPKRRPVSLAR
jgi:hypothetical protein